MEYLDRCAQVYKPWVACESQRDGFSRIVARPRATGRKASSCPFGGSSLKNKNILTEKKESLVCSSKEKRPAFWCTGQYSNQLSHTHQDLENIMPSEISQSEKDKYYMIALICGI